jgi:tetratricopeptide (TPR) repeat protein
LEEAAAKTGDDKQDQLARVQLGLIKIVQQQVVQLRTAHKDVEAAKACEAFGDFVSHIAKQQEEGAWASRYVVAQTYFMFGDCLRSQSLSGPAQPADGRAREYFTKARDLYQQLSAETGKDAAAAPSPAMALIVKKQLGECDRQLGDYKAAIALYSAVLQEKEAELSVQRAAALAYQSWGMSEDPKWFENAIHGSDKNLSTGKNRIWGWLRLALVAERASRTNPQFRDTFFEARLESARCRYLAAAKAEGDAKKQQLDIAKQSIRSMLPLYPDLGGDEWRGKFDELVKVIQQAGGEEQVGLKEFAAAEKPAKTEQDDGSK